MANADIVGYMWWYPSPQHRPVATSAGKQRVELRGIIKRVIPAETHGFLAGTVPFDNGCKVKIGMTSLQHMSAVRDALQQFGRVDIVNDQGFQAQQATDSATRAREQTMSSSMVNATSAASTLDRWLQSRPAGGKASKKRRTVDRAVQIVNIAQRRAERASRMENDSSDDNDAGEDGEEGGE